MKNMTPEERKALGKDKGSGKAFGTRADLLNGLVKNNLLTQEQVDAIKTKLGELAQTQQQQ